MNWSLQSLHRKGAVLMVVLTIVLVAMSLTLTVLGSSGLGLAASWAGTILTAANTIALVHRVRKTESEHTVRSGGSRIS